MTFRSKSFLQVPQRLQAILLGHVLDYIAEDHRVEPPLQVVGRGRGRRE